MAEPRSKKAQNRSSRVTLETREAGKGKLKKALPTHERRAQPERKKNGRSSSCIKRPALHLGGAEKPCKENTERKRQRKKTAGRQQEKSLGLLLAATKRNVRGNLAQQ